ncbi:MAG: electron transfer flavoprotein subunit alpha/FixB family protein [Pseudomonadota bacterium]
MMGQTRPRRKVHARRAAMFPGPTGRLRYDPRRAPNGMLKQARRAPTPTLQAPLYVVENPKFYILCVLEGDTAGDNTALSAARALADVTYAPAKGAVVSVAATPIDALDNRGADRTLTLARAPAGAFAAEHMATSLTVALHSLPARHVVFSDTSTMRDVAARVAAQLGERPAFGVHAFDGDRCIRSGFGSTKDIKATIPTVLSVDDGAAKPVRGQRFEARCIAIDLPSQNMPSCIMDLGAEAVPANHVALEEAPLILAAGAGIDAWDAFADVAEHLNATQAGSRVVCDNGSLPRDRQVGASGRLVTADCYIALGISGALQHLQGIEDCGRVIAVNTDPAAPILKRADLAIIGDANAILKAAAHKLEEA